MATILITGDDFAAVGRVRGVGQALGHCVLHAATTENIIEDVALNQVVLVIAGQGTRPFSEWEVCEMLRSDPTLPLGLAVLLLHSGDFDHRRLASSSFDGDLNSNLPAPILSEAVVHHLGEDAAPESSDPLARSKFD